MSNMKPRQTYLKRELKRTTGLRSVVERASMGKGDVGRASIPGEMGLRKGSAGMFPVRKLRHNSCPLTIHHKHFSS